MTHLIKKEGERYFIYFSEHLFPTEESSLGNYKYFVNEWFESCAKKGNKVEVAKDQEDLLRNEALTRFINMAHGRLDSEDLDAALVSGIVIPECYEVRHGYSLGEKFAYFKSPEPEHSQEREKLHDYIRRLWKAKHSDEIGKILLEFRASLVSKDAEDSRAANYPTDEEIKSQSDSRSKIEAGVGRPLAWHYFELGAKWMRDRVMQNV